MKRRLDFLTFAALSAALFLFSGSGFVLYHMVTSSLEAVTRVAESYELRSGLAELSADLKFLRRSARAYLLSGDEDLGASIGEGKNAAVRSIEDAKRLTLGRPHQQQRLSELEREIDELFRGVESLAETRREHGPEAARSATSAATALSIGQPVQGLLSELVADADRMLVERKSREQKEAQRRGWTIGLASLCVFLLMGAALLLVRRDNLRRRAAESALRLLSERLDQRIRERTSDLASANEALLASEEKLRAVAERLQHVLATSPTLIYAIDLTADPPRANWVSGNIAAILGYSASEALAPGWWAEGVHPQDLPAASTATERLLSRNLVAHEYRFRHKDGSYVWVRDHLRLLRDADGRPNEAIGSLTDITDLKQAELSLREREERMRQVLQNMPVLLAAFDDVGAIMVWNTEWERALGYSANELIGNPHGAWRYYPDPVYRRRVVAEWKARNRDYRNWELELTAKDGSKRFILWSDISHSNPVPGWPKWGVGVDVTERREAELALAANERRYRFLFELNPLPMYVHDRDTLEILAVNRAMVRDYGFSREELLRMNLRDVRLPEQAPRPGEARNRSPAPNAGWGEWPHRRKDGSVTIAAVHGVDAEFEGRAVRLCLAEDITERKRTEQVLHEYAQRLQELSRRLLQVQEAERRALAKELHDEVGQSLTAVKLNLHAIKKLVADKAAADRLGDSLEIVEVTISQIRDRALDLRPSVLDDLGLVPALDWYVKRQAKRGGCAIFLDARSLSERPAPEVEIACFRVVQEAVNNALRHGHPKRMDVALERKPDRLTVRVRDDGRGFAVIPAVERSRSGGGLGLLGMRERVELIGGEFSLRSAPNEGAEIYVEFPWSGAESGTDARIAG